MSPGVGIGTNHLPRLFDYFFTTAPAPQLNYTYSRQFGAPFTGLGMGLASVRQYAAVYGGDVTVAPRPVAAHGKRSPGSGTRGEVRLPRRGTVPL